MAIKKQYFYNIMNNSTKFQLYPTYSFRGVDFLIYFRKFNFLVAMATNQIEMVGLK